jgi:hypothetical protein
MQLDQGNGNAKANSQSAEYSRITHKRILKICGERFSGEPDTIGRRGEKERALTFDKDIVKKAGKTFEIISEIKILEPPDNYKEQEEAFWILSNNSETSSLVTPCRISILIFLRTLADYHHISYAVLLSKKNVFHFPLALKHTSKSFLHMFKMPLFH